MDAQEMIAQAFEALEERRIDDYLDLFDDAVLCHDVMHAPGWGRLALRKELGELATAFPDFRLRAMVCLSDEQVVVRYSFRGTHQGELAGLQATGRVVQFDGRMELRLAGEQVVEHWSDLHIELKLQIAMARLAAA